MWFITTSGFVSIVQKAEDRGNGTLTVRARDAKSLDLFGQAAGRAPRAYKMDMATDYPFRDTFTRVEVGNALLVFVETLDYSNFKNAAKIVRGEVFAKALNNVWWDMQALTPRKIKNAMDKAWKLPAASRWSSGGAWDAYVPPTDVLEPEDAEVDVETKRISEMTDAEWHDYLREMYGDDVVDGVYPE